MHNQKIFINSRGVRLNRKAHEQFAKRITVDHPLGLNFNVMIDSKKNKMQQTQTQPPQTMQMPQALHDQIIKFLTWDEPDKLKFRLFNILHHAMSSHTVDDVQATDRNEMFNDIQCIYDLIDVINVTYSKQIEKN